MNVKDMFALAAEQYAAATVAYAKAIEAGESPLPPINGLTLYAFMYYGESPRKYGIRGYRLIGQAQQIELAAAEWTDITAKNLDIAAAKAGYALAYPPQTGYMHKLVYRAVDPAQPPSGYTAHGDQWAQHNAQKRQEAAIMAAGAVKPVEQRIKIVNVKGMAPNSPGIWYCGREWAGWHASVLANPHHMKSEATRGEASQKFADDLWDDVQQQGPLYKELRKMQQRLEAGETVTLGCWCAPKACHCDRIRNGLLWLIANQPLPPTPLTPAAAAAETTAPRIQYQVASDTPIPTDPKEMRQQLAALGWDKKAITNMMRMQGRAKHMLQHNITPEQWAAIEAQAQVLHTPPAAAPVKMVAMKEVNGDAIELAAANSGVLIHQVNCKKVAGAGIALAIAKRWPGWKNAYLKTQPHLGTAFAWQDDATGVVVISLYAQDGYGTNKRQTDYGAFKTAIGQAAQMIAAQYADKPVYIPSHIGCGLAGGDWNIVKPLLAANLPSATIVTLPPAPPAPTLPDNAYRMIVAGSRTFTDYDLLCSKLDAAAAKLTERGQSLVIVCGMAEGADLLGKQWADAHGIPVAEYPANWKRYGKSAGFRRNDQMADNADHLLAFWDGKDADTQHLIEAARKRKLPVKIVKFTPAPPPTPPAPAAKPPFYLAIGCDSGNAAVQELLRKEMEVSRKRLADAGFEMVPVKIKDKRAQGLLLIHNSQQQAPKTERPVKVYIAPDIAIQQWIPVDGLSHTERVLKVFEQRDLPVREVTYTDDYNKPAAPPTKAKTPAAAAAAVAAPPPVAPAVNMAARAAAAAASAMHLRTAMSVQDDDNPWGLDFE